MTHREELAALLELANLLATLIERIAEKAAHDEPPQPVISTLPQTWN